MQIIILTLSAAFLVQLGYFIWKLAARDLPRIGREKHFVVLKAFLTSWKWLLGMALRLVGLFLFVKATSIGALSLIQPLMSAGDVFIILLAVVFLKERLGHTEWTGLFLVVLGAFAISWGAHVTSVLDFDWYKVAVFVGCAFGILITMIFLARKTGQLEIFLGICVGITFGVSMTLVKLMTTYLTLSGLSVNLFNSIVNPIFPFIIANNIVGLIILQIAFQNGRAAVIIPLQVAVVSGVSVLAGIILFSEVVSMHRLASIALILLGTVLLQKAAHVKNFKLNTP